MDVKITYPIVEKKRIQRKKLIHILRWPFLLAVIACPVANFLVGGAFWSPIVLLGMYMFWTLVLCPDLVEYNRLSQTIKLLCYSCGMLVLIDYFLSPGWAIRVVPIVGFGGVAVAGILLFSDLQRQKQNMLPLLVLIFLGILGSVIGLSLWREESRWALIVLGSVSLVLLLICCIALRSDFWRELKRRCHIK